MARFRFAPDTNPEVRQQCTQRTVYSSTVRKPIVLLVDASKAFNSLKIEQPPFITSGIFV